MNEETIESTESGMDLLQLVVFQLGDEEFGVDVMQVKVIIRMPRITRIPQAPDYVKGVINLRGKINVVINLAKRFSQDSKEIDEHSRIIVVEVDTNEIGMIVDSVSEVKRIPRSDVEPAPAIITSKISEDYLRGVGKVDNRLLILLNLEKVLTGKEVEEISAIENSSNTE
ncbi:MAG: chemotaxis protein CheW [Methanosarcinaceae archaeon]